MSMGGRNKSYDDTVKEREATGNDKAKQRNKRTTAAS